MTLSDQSAQADHLVLSMIRNVSLDDGIRFPRGRGDIVHRRPSRFIHLDGRVVAREHLDRLDSFDWVGWQADPDSYETLSEEVVYNVKTNVGIVFLHTQTYGTGPGANGLNYIALSNDPVTETSASTSLSNEIAVNGLQRVQGAVTLPVGAGTVTTITNTFTASGGQSAQKAALFSAAVGGVMQHVLAFSQRALLTGDQLIITFSLTVS